MPILQTGGILLSAGVGCLDRALKLRRTSLRSVWPNKEL